MDEFIFPIGKIFSTDSDGVLGQCGCSKYYIGPYQRGYKWGSTSRYEQVPQMLIDIYEAMSAKTSEYFLQYITVKKNVVDDNSSVLEVIDGQQRLTTLSLFFYRLADRGEYANIAKDKVSYARYIDENSCVTSIFECVEAEIKNGTIPKDARTQDLFYLLSAANCINKFFEILESEQLLSDYVDYVCNHVLLIVNIESEFVSSEDVFANLNDNKVRLTDTYLIKGLLLTNAIQRVNSNGNRRNYKEILDQRKIMGRMWDEIMAWVSNGDVAHYFFGANNRYDGMRCLLEFVCSLIKPASITSDSNRESIISRFSQFLNIEGDKSETTDAFPLFNRYNDKIKTTESACEALSVLKHVYLKLKCLYENYQDSTLYNLLGYAFFCDNIKLDDGWVKERDDIFRKKMLTVLIDRGESDFKRNLLEIVRSLIPTMEDDIKFYRAQKSILEQVELSHDQYREALVRYDYLPSNSVLRNLLLSFSVFPEIPCKSYRFDFCQYDSESWSFEHIYPQHPKSTEKLKIHTNAAPVVCSAIRNVLNSIERVESERRSRLNRIVEKILASESLVKEEIDEIGFLYDCNFDIHQCGNMALLSGGVNSALSNNPFIAKRPILMGKAISGYFVPAHTMSVFNKSLVDRFVPELSQWTVDDVSAHMHWQIKRNAEIIKSLKEDEYR